MSEFITVARPYAKAAFDFAVEHQSVERWQDMLAFAAEVIWSLMAAYAVVLSALQTSCSLKGTGACN